MALYSIQGETLSEIADAIREKTETEEPIQTNEMSSMIRKIEGSTPNAVLYTEQSLTDEQKAQARENIGAAAVGEGGGSSENAVLYTEQDLTSEQKNQARKNIDIHVGEEPADADEGAVWIDPNGTNLILGNAIMAEDINDGDVEIFGSFISEDSVIAKDENSDGNINLQTFVKGEGPSVEYATKEELAVLTAADVGAHPNTWMPTAEDVGARPANWMPSAEDVGAAPAVENADYSGCYYRIVDDVTEWLNPPMVAGVEYRTTERYNGKPVYAKIIDCGAMPNATKKSIAHGITNYQDIVDLRGTMISSGGTIGFLPMSSGNIETDWNIGVVSDNIFLVTNADRSTWTAKVLIKVTKTTD